jgi:hypothetical protein
MNDLVNFTYESKQVRTVVKDGEPWWVAKDVAGVLGYTSTNMPQIFSHVPAEWKGSNPITTPGGEQSMLCLSEHGLYFFLGRSDKPKALPFQKWIAGEVIPSIRKTGSYTVPGREKPEPPKWVCYYPFLGVPESAAELALLMEACDEGRISVEEFRRAILSRDNPPQKEPSPPPASPYTQTHTETALYLAGNKKDPESVRFVEKNLNITLQKTDFIPLTDLYSRYKAGTEQPLTRNKLVRRIRAACPGIEYKQKKINGKPELAFLGCKFKNL